MGRIYRKLQSEFYNTKVMDYSVGKLKLHDTCQMVDWSALGAHHRNLSCQHQATRLKFIFQLAPTNAIQPFLGQSKQQSTHYVGWRSRLWIIDYTVRHSVL